jgi:ATP-dependent helicase/nuclease subunit A
MTRAKERLILSGGLPARAAKGAFLGLLQEAASGEIGQAGQSAVHIGPVSFGQTMVVAADRAPRRRKQAPAKLRAPAEWKSLVSRWEQRDRAWETARSTPVHLTPTRLGGRKEQGVGAAGPEAGSAGQGRLIGTLAHRVLQHWDFSDAPEKLRERITAVCRQDITEDRAGTMAEIERELQELLRTFTASEPYWELQRATILGREVPFAIPWEGEGRGARGKGPKTTDQPLASSPVPLAGTPCVVMEGIIDVVYRLDGKIHLADYKTDRVQDSEVPARAATYEGQARIYRAAVSRCLGMTDVGVQLIFVRNGKAVSV